MSHRSWVETPQGTLSLSACSSAHSGERALARALGRSRARARTFPPFPPTARWYSAWSRCVAWEQTHRTDISWARGKVRSHAAGKSFPCAQHLIRTGVPPGSNSVYYVPQAASAMRDIWASIRCEQRLRIRMSLRTWILQEQATCSSSRLV